MYISKQFDYNNKRIHLKCKSDAIPSFCDRHLNTTKLFQMPFLSYRKVHIARIKRMIVRVQKTGTQKSVSFYRKLNKI